MLEPSRLPPEILDAIIDELQNDKQSLLQASLACKAICPRTRVHLFSIASLSSQSDCDRLLKLITLSPKLALHFKSLNIMMIQLQDIHETLAAYGGLTVIESLVNVTRLSLLMGDWRHVPDTVVSSLQSRSYRTLAIGMSFEFRSVGEICPLVKNSPGLQQVSLTCGNALTEECGLDHSLHCIPTPIVLQVIDTPCPFSFRNIHTFNISLPDDSGTVSRHLYRYLALSDTALKRLYVMHHVSGSLNASSRTLHITSIEKITVKVVRTSRVHYGLLFRVFEWWISNLSAVDEHCAIRSITFKVMLDLPVFQEEHPALEWEDLWMRLDGCLASYKIASLERVAITFEPRVLTWDTLKARMEQNFLGLKRLGCELVLDAVT
ncbi:uncharacterized protein ARMOST_21938 [Armillaria ostoyae]|uniref:F-box domain-containing protein n=1 Tax=Armillaria ostoyae TaxID=47428 RepID=A0A284SBG1_ARMOS|nr:uncharacterized protein ARMOST_21938 [Armillaria ostoyae]